MYHLVEESDQNDDCFFITSSAVGYLLNVNNRNAGSWYDLYSPESSQRSANPATAAGEDPNTSKLQNCDFKQTILLNSGALNDQHLKKRKHNIRSVASMIKTREVGMNGRHHFSLGDCAHVNKRFLPNKVRHVDTYQGKAFCGNYTANGEMFLSACQDLTIRLYNTNDCHFKLKSTVEALDVGWSILDTAISPDCTQFIYCSWSESIHICDIENTSNHYALPLHPEDKRFCVFSLKFSHDGNEILAGANDQCLYIYDREVNRQTLRILSHNDDVNSVAFADNTSQILFSASDDGICKVWDRRTLCEQSPKPVGILVGHADGITYIDPRGDGRHLITNSKDQSIKLWDMRVFSPSSSLDEAYKVVKSNNWDYRWQKLPRNLNKKKNKLLGDKSLMTYSGHSVLQTLIRCHFSPEVATGQRFIYTGCALGQIVVYDALTGQIETHLKGHSSCVRDVSWHPYKNEIASSSWDGSVMLWAFSPDESKAKHQKMNVPYNLRN